MEYLRKPFFAALLILSLGVLSYSNTFRVPFVFDDQPSIIDNPVIRSLDNFLTNTSGYEYQERRFVAYLSFALNYRLGGLDVVGYHVFNLVVHLANALLLYAFMRLTFRTPCLGSSRLAPWAGTVALLCSVLFVVHPVQTQAVTYIVQRLTSLATLFYLLAVVLYVVGRLRVEGGGRWRRGLPWLAGSVLAAVLGMKTKEICFTLPFAACLYEASFFRGEWKRRLLFLLPLLLTAAMVPISLLGAGEPAGDLLSDVSDRLRGESRVSRWDYLFTQFRVIVTYLRLLILPIHQNLDYDYPIYTSFFTLPVFLSFLLLTTLFVLATHLYGFQFNSRTPTRTGDPATRLVSFGILWFFLGLSVESSLVPIADVIFEHRIYLPSVGAATAFATGLVLFCCGISPAAWKKPVSVIVVLVVIGLGIGTYKRNAIWGTQVGLWEDAVRKSPAKTRPRVNLGMVLNVRGDTDLAIEQLSEALKIDPTSAEAHTNLGLSYLKKKMVDAAIREFEHALAIHPNISAARLNLGAAYSDRGELDAAIVQYLAAAESDPDNAIIHNNLGVAYFRKGMVDQAIAHLRRAVALMPDYPDAHYNLGIAYGGKGWSRQAQEEMAFGMMLKNAQGAR